MNTPELAATEHSESTDETNRIQHLSNVMCSGQESRLTDCSYGVIGVDTCLTGDPRVNAAVVCSGTVHTTEDNMFPKGLCL